MPNTNWFQHYNSLINSNHKTQAYFAFNWIENPKEWKWEKSTKIPAHLSILHKRSWLSHTKCNYSSASRIGVFSSPSHYYALVADICHALSQRSALLCKRTMKETKETFVMFNALSLPADLMTKQPTQSSADKYSTCKIYLSSMIWILAGILMLKSIGIRHWNIVILDLKRQTL